MADISELLTKSSQDKVEIKTQVKLNGQPFKSLKFRTESLLTQHQATIISEQNIGGTNLIWGNSTFGIWGSFYWATVANNSFVLGNSLAGVLGTSKLGERNSSFEVKRIVPPNDIFEEYFVSNYFIDTISNCTIGNNLITFNSTSEFLQSNTIYKNDVNVDHIKIFISTTGDIDKFSIKVTNEDTTWEDLDDNTIHSFTTSGQIVKYRIIPLVVPARLNKITVEVNK